MQGDDRATSRLERIMGSEGLARLERSHVMVLGLGGVGSNCVEALARGGVGTLTIVDHDRVELSNINRQAIAFRSTIGKQKTVVTQGMIKDINPTARVISLDEFLFADHVDTFFEQHGTGVDYVVDAIDTISTKLALAQYADAHDMTFISSMGAANKLRPDCFTFADIYDTVNCPMCRIVRKEARKRGIAHIPVLYSSEHPVKVPTAEGATRRDRSDLGTASFVPPIMGQMIAGEVLCHLAGIQR
jgi:tRNA A37 threonylcarbamoyladenosine dehydratase